MRVTLCVDALGPELSGIGRYTWELCKGLQAIDELKVRYFGRNRLIPDPAILLDGRMPTRRRRGLRKLGGWLDKRSLRKDVVHGPNFFLPAFAGRGVITVHDLSVYRYDQTHPAERVAQFEQQFESSLARASHIITDTHTVKQELIADFGVEPDRITPIHLGVSGEFSPHAATSLEGLAIPGLAAGTYALCVSTLEPRKKISELLDSWGRLPKDLRQRFPLVLAGGAGWRNDALKEKIGRAQAEGWLRYLGYVQETSLPGLYAGAALFIYPSSYEGFGLPPLEAMASGTPVIVASGSCMPEVCGNAAAYVDPDDPDAMDEVIMRSLEDDAWRADMALRGPLRAQDFTWARCVEATAEVYRKVQAIS